MKISSNDRGNIVMPAAANPAKMAGPNRIQGFGSADAGRTASRPNASFSLAGLLAPSARSAAKRAIASAVEANVERTLKLALDGYKFGNVKEAGEAVKKLAEICTAHPKTAPKLGLNCDGASMPPLLEAVTRAGDSLAAQHLTLLIQSSVDHGDWLVHQAHGFLSLKLTPSNATPHYHLECYRNGGRMAQVGDRVAFVAPDQRAVEGVVETTARPGGALVTMVRRDDGTSTMVKWKDGLSGFTLHSPETEA